jgi:alkylated DNA repair protein (DNA oxidative demethylase)
MTARRPYRPSDVQHGLHVLKGLALAAEADILADARAVVAAAPLVRPTMAGGTPMKVRVTSCGLYGWGADDGGYYYEERHPSGAPWPAMPDSFTRVLTRALAVSGNVQHACRYDSCLINVYGPDGSLGWHQDVTERDRQTPIVGVSLGDTARFEVELGEEIVVIEVASSDVIVMGGFSRLARHRVASIEPPGLYTRRSPLAQPGRISLTFRRVMP